MLSPFGGRSREGEREGGKEGGREGRKEEGKEGESGGVEGKRGREGECTSAHSLPHGQHHPMWRRKIPQGHEGGPI